MIDCTPSARNQSALAVERTLATSSCPRSLSWGTSRCPIAPVAPVMKMRMMTSLVQVVRVLKTKGGHRL